MLFLYTLYFKLVSWYSCLNTWYDLFLISADVEFKKAKEADLIMYKSWCLRFSLTFAFEIYPLYLIVFMLTLYFWILTSYFWRLTSHACPPLARFHVWLYFCLFPFDFFLAPPLSLFLSQYLIININLTFDLNNLFLNLWLRIFTNL
jgi:hypothetical protein